MQLNPGNVSLMSRLKAWLPMVEPIAKNDKDRLRKGTTSDQSLNKALVDGLG